MSLLDVELIFSGTKASGAADMVGQAISASGANNATYDVDTLAAGDAIKSGAIFKAICTELFAGTGTVVKIDLTTCAEATFASPTTLYSTGNIAKANATAKTVLCQTVIPVGVLRYLRVVYTTDNTFETTGRIASFIVLNPEKTLDKQM